VASIWLPKLINMANFAVLIGSQDFSGAVKLLDAEIDEAQAGYQALLHKLVQLHLNRGICNQKLQLNRKALKVGCASAWHARHERQYQSQVGRP
jgi:hypothetical protein